MNEADYQTNHTLCSIQTQSLDPAVIERIMSLVCRKLDADMDRISKLIKKNKRDYSDCCRLTNLLNREAIDLKLLDQGEVPIIEESNEESSISSLSRASRSPKHSSKFKASSFQDSSSSKVQQTPQFKAKEENRSISRPASRSRRKPDFNHNQFLVPHNHRQILDEIDSLPDPKLIEHLQTHMTSNKPRSVQILISKKATTSSYDTEERQAIRQAKLCASKLREFVSLNLEDEIEDGQTDVPKEASQITNTQRSLSRRKAMGAQVGRSAQVQESGDLMQTLLDSFASPSKQTPRETSPGSSSFKKTAIGRPVSDYRIDTSRSSKKSSGLSNLKSPIVRQMMDSFTPHSLQEAGIPQLYSATGRNRVLR